MEQALCRLVSLVRVLPPPLPLLALLFLSLALLSKRQSPLKWAQSHCFDCSLGSLVGECRCVPIASPFSTPLSSSHQISAPARDPRRLKRSRCVTPGCALLRTGLSLIASVRHPRGDGPGCRPAPARARRSAKPRASTVAPGTAQLSFLVTALAWPFTAQLKAIRNFGWAG